MPRLAVDDFGNYVTGGAWGIMPNGHTIAHRYAGTFGAVSLADARMIGVYACLRQVL